MDRGKTGPIFHSLSISSLSLSRWGVLAPNDAASAVAPSGIVFRREERISIDKEEPTISRKRMEVSDEFRNESKETGLRKSHFQSRSIDTGLSADA
jgi:hypothetical protein